MAKIRYISTLDPTDDQVCTVLGKTFQKGKVVSVPDDLAAALSGNPTFEIVSGNVASDETAAVEPEAEQPAVSSDQG